MVVIIKQMQVSWFKPWTRRTLVVTGKNFEEAYEASKSNNVDWKILNFTHSFKVHEINQ